jgi:hypothetical protein
MTNEEATAAIHSKECPGCGLEPEVRNYYRDTKTKIRCGYHCSCGAVVINGLMVGSDLT